MIEYLNLFKSLPVEARTETFSTDFLDLGVLVEDAVVQKYGKKKVRSFVEHLIPKDSELNKTFHKSWKKVRDASIEQLVLEQVAHYITTYGFEEAGIYNENTVYIPNETLTLEAEGGITFLALRGITQIEIEKRVGDMLESGIALSDSDLDDLISVIKDRSLAIDPAHCANREMKVRLYDVLNLVPSDPVEYLRLQVYRITDSSLLIKSPEVIVELAKTKKNVFQDYEKAHGLERLAEIFLRFKPLFLALKNKKSARTVNRIRKLAKRHHKPMPEDCLASVTKHIRNATFDAERFREALKEANAFRKIRLMQVLRTYEAGKHLGEGIVYSIRNGKSFTTTTKPIEDATEAQLILIKSLGEDLKHLEGKKVFLNAGLVAPTSGKMFVGDIPMGSFFSTRDSLVLGVSWKDVKSRRIDLDLSLVSVTGKTGWDAAYPSDDFIFSGDVTAAPNGATEAHLVRAGVADGIYLLNLNYFNSSSGAPEVPFTMFVAEENEFDRMDKNAMVSQDNMLFWAESVIDSERAQKVIGVLKVRDGVKNFHVFESKMGRGISSRVDERALNMISHYEKQLDSVLTLRDMLEWAGAKLVSSPEEADIDLSLDNITKDKLVKLITG